MNPQGLQKEPFALRAAHSAAYLFRAVVQSWYAKPLIGWDTISLLWHKSKICGWPLISMTAWREHSISTVILNATSPNCSRRSLNPARWYLTSGPTLAISPSWPRAKSALREGSLLLSLTPEIFALKMNLSLNHATNIHPVPQALFNQIGTISLHVSSETEDNLGSSSVVDAAHGRSVVEVTTGTLDDFISKQALLRVDVVKMDIEGAEFGASRARLSP